jgi:hypothetical protein
MLCEPNGRRKVVKIVVEAEHLIELLLAKVDSRIRKVGFGEMFELRDEPALGQHNTTDQR